MRAWLANERFRTWLGAGGCYLALLLVYLLVAGPARLTDHTPYNHFALLADSWIHGRLDLGGSPPDYAGANDFSQYDGKWYVPFPAFPALLLVPLVYFAGSAELVRDAQFFVSIAPLGPALLFVILERLRLLGRSGRSRWENLALTFSFGLGSVYFFSAVQGSVWFAAHVVAVALGAGYVLMSIDARRPGWAGLCLGLGYLSRSTLLFGAPFFLFEAWRACRSDGKWPAWGPLCRRILLFAAPFALCFAASLLHNYARFDDPFEVGYRYLQIAWQGRIEKWGLFHYHYLAKNLGVMLTSLPWIHPLRINLHGLALWLTTPIYLYLIWPCQPRPGFAGLLVTAACIGIPALFYQNTGWMQFGYRFSNDYALLLFVALALSRPRLRWHFWVLSLWGVAINSFGAVTFDRAQYARYYYQQPSQEALYQPN
ncbi:MAG TPA: hypothetical protein VFS67_22625 [Polyangiaceae bacterium]|nr:hypothetical protein [Polyangiaceae bacterium]